MRRVVVTVIAGALAYPVASLLFDDQSSRFTLAAAVGACALVVRFLAEIDQRLAAVEAGQVENSDELGRLVDDGFQRVSDATEAFSRIGASGLSTDRLAELADKAGEIGPEASPLIVAFAQSEIDRVTELCGALAGSALSRDGEDHDYLLTLTGIAQRSIDATSLFAVDAAGMSLGGGFWDSAEPRKTVGSTSACWSRRW